MQAPKCRLCGANHWSGEPHKFEPDAPALREKVATIPKCVHKTEDPKEVCTQLREVNIRQFRSKMADELNNLPFNLVRNGKVIAVVREK
jgi:hypothetical protein